MQGGPDKTLKPMRLDDYPHQVFEGPEAKDRDEGLKKEVAVVLGQMCVDTWRERFGKILESMKLDY